MKKNLIRLAAITTLTLIAALLILGTASAATIIGGGGDDTIIGSPNDDTIDGGGGDDTIDGSGGNDNIDGGPGDDTIDGGPGTDTLNASTSASPVAVDIPNGTMTGEGNDTFQNVENFTGSPFDDTFTTEGGGYTIDGGDGDDTVTYRAGGSGGDTAIGGAHVVGDTLYIDLGEAIVTDGDDSNVPEDPGPQPGSGGGWGLDWSQFENVVVFYSGAVFYGTPAPDCGKNPYAWNAIAGQYERPFHRDCQQFTGDPNESLLHGAYLDGGLPPQ